MSTAELIAALCAEVAIEDNSARELAAMLETAAAAAEGASDGADQLAELVEDEDEAAGYQGSAAELFFLADELSAWALQLRTALLTPPDQRQAIR